MEKGVEACARKSGRRPKAPQTLPLILPYTRNRIAKVLTLDSETLRLIESYVSWAASKGALSKEDATILLLSKSVQAFCKKDNLYQQEVVRPKADLAQLSPQE